MSVVNIGNAYAALAAFEQEIECWRLIEEGKKCIIVRVGVRACDFDPNIAPGATIARDEHLIFFTKAEATEYIRIRAMAVAIDAADKITLDSWRQGAGA